MSKVRTRYAPSPTGFFHIGGARTALFNYLFAKHNGGDFIVRAEDTDIERNIDGGIDAQLDGLEWLGIIPDESPRKINKYKNISSFAITDNPYIQSSKFVFFKELGEKLVKEKKAYYCFCTSEELDELREKANENKVTPKYNQKCLKLTQKEINNKIANNIPFAIRLKLPENVNYEWNDLIRGKISVPSEAMSDPIIVKSNGIPTYNFAVVVDDHEMEITHVIRGEEHISNTPYQLAIMNALGYDINKIKFGHLSVIVDETGKKLSKRNKTLKQFVISDGDDYKNLGYISQAITNFIALLGWSDKNNREILTINELIKEFDETRISKSPSFFDIKKMNDKEYLKYAKKFIKINISSLNDQNLAILTFKNQISHFDELNHLINDTFLEVNFNDIEQILNNNQISKEDFKKNVATFEKILVEYKNITETNANEIINKIKELSGLKGKALFMPIRLITIGKEHGPEMNKILPVIGYKKIIDNLKKIKLKY